MPELDPQLLADHLAIRQLVDEDITPWTFVGHAQLCGVPGPQHAADKPLGPAFDEG